MKAATNGIKTHYLDAGDPAGLPIVLIHGFPFSHKMWRPQIDLLQQHFRVIAYDVRGHGKTAAGDGQYTIELFVDDLFSLLDRLKIPKAVLCGLSMGGYIALRAAERRPDRVRALVLCDTRSEADSNEAKLKRAASLKQIQQEGTASFAQGLLPALFSPAGMTGKPELVGRIRRMILANPALGVGGTLLALAGRTDTTASLAQIAVPALLLVGASDAITPPAAMQAMRERIPGAAMETIPDAGHLSNLENETEFNRHLLAFLRRIA